jgi:hypothetical protein
LHIVTSSFSNKAIFASFRLKSVGFQNGGKFTGFVLYLHLYCIYMMAMGNGICISSVFTLLVVSLMAIIDVVHLLYGNVCLLANTCDTNCLII